MYKICIRVCVTVRLHRSQTILMAGEKSDFLRLLNHESVELVTGASKTNGDLVELERKVADGVCSIRVCWKQDGHTMSDGHTL